MLIGKRAKVVPLNTGVIRRVGAIEGAAIPGCRQTMTSSLNSTQQENFTAVCNNLAKLTEDFALEWSDSDLAIFFLLLLFSFEVE